MPCMNSMKLFTLVAPGQVEAGLIPAIIEHAWDVNNLLDENSTGGAMLKALFGYNGNPSLSEVLAYLAYFVVTFSSLRLIDRSVGRSAQKLV